MDVGQSTSAQDRMSVTRKLTKGKEKGKTEDKYHLDPGAIIPKEKHRVKDPLNRQGGEKGMPPKQ